MDGEKFLMHCGFVTNDIDMIMMMMIEEWRGCVWDEVGCGRVWWSVVECGGVEYNVMIV